MAMMNNRSGNRGSGGAGFRPGAGRTDSAYVYAPYNFVPFPNAPAYIEEDKIVGHDVLADTADDGEELFSGEIRYSLESMTPIFVDDGTKQHRFCRNAAGDFMIPGSTMRGLIRSNAMVLGLGNVRDEVDDYSLMYRNVANGLNKKRYGDILGTGIAKMHSSSGKDYTLSVLKNVQAGYIEKTEGGKYVIYKTAIDPADGKSYAIDPNLGKMNYYTLSERFVIEQYLKNKGKYTADPDSFPYSLLIPDMQNRMMNQTKPFREEYDRNGNLSYKGVNNFSYIPYHVPAAYRLFGNRNISELKPITAGTSSNSSNGSNNGSGSGSGNGNAYEHGVLVSTGFMQKKKVIYVIPGIKCSGPGGTPEIAVELSDRDVRDFKVDYNRRKNSISLEKKNPLREIDKGKWNEVYKAFFNLPEETGEKGRKPVFYIQLGKRCYFGFTPRLRLFYDNTVADGISRTHVSGKTDYVKAIFGYTSSGKTPGTASGKSSLDKDMPDARKTRVSFSDAVQVQPPKELPPRFLTLSEPRPTDCLNYLDQSSGETSYNSRQMQLRGAKQYWLHREADPGVEPGHENKNLDSLLNPLDSGSRFQGTIRFKNLRKHELGLLLWSVRLEDSSWMNIGKGKPYGYGAVKLSILSVRSLDYRKAYGLPLPADDGVIVSPLKHSADSFVDASVASSLDSSLDASSDSSGGSRAGYDGKNSSAPIASTDISGNRPSDDGMGSLAALFCNPYRDLDTEELINAYKLHIRKSIGNRDIMTLPLIRDFFAMKDSLRIPDAEATRYMTLEQFQDQTRNKTPLPTPLDFISKHPGPPPAVGSVPSRTGATAGMPSGMESSATANSGPLDAVVFLAGYSLSDSQKQKLEEMSGLPAVHVNEWPNDENVVKYARQYKGIALPANAYPKFIETSKRHCPHVYKAVKSGKLDNGWSCLKQS